MSQADLAAPQRVGFDDALQDLLANPLSISERVGSIVFQPLDRDDTPPAILVEDLLYDGGFLHLLSAHPGSGKSTLALFAAARVTDVGRDVVWLDYEMSPKQTWQRLIAVGASPDR